jgi:4-oxalocrotonate tautomerase
MTTKTASTSTSWIAILMAGADYRAVGRRRGRAVLDGRVAFRSRSADTAGREDPAAFRSSPRRGGIVPYVNIRFVREKVSKQQKAALIRGVTNLLHDILKKNPATTVVVIDEIDADNWGLGGESVSLRKKRREG